MKRLEPNILQWNDLEKYEPFNARPRTSRGFYISIVLIALALSCGALWGVAG